MYMFMLLFFVDCRNHNDCPNSGYITSFSIAMEMYQHTLTAIIYRLFKYKQYGKFKKHSVLPKYQLE